MNERLYRSRDERIISGVAGGVAERFRVDPSLVRILWVILVPLTGGLALLLYIVMILIVPSEPAGDTRWAAWDRQSGSGYQWPDAGTAPAAAAGATDATASPDATDAAPATDAEPSEGPSAAAAAGGTAAAFVAPSSAPAQNPPTGSSWQQTSRDARRASHGGRSGSGAVLFGLILIVVGGYFFARTYLPQIDVDQVWPLVFVGLGVILLVGSFRRGSDHPD